MSDKGCENEGSQSAKSATPTSPPPPPNPSADPKLAAQARTPPPLDAAPAASSQDIFKLPPIAALKLLCTGIEKLVRVTGDIPPTPPPKSPTMPNMRDMQREKAAIVRSHSEKNLLRLQEQAAAEARRKEEQQKQGEQHEQPRPPSGSFESNHPPAAQPIDGVRLRNPFPSPPRLTTAKPEPYLVIGANSQPLNLQHSAITRKFYSKAPPPISVEDYLLRMHRFCPMSTAVYLATSYYIHRLAVEERAIPVTRRNCHRLLLGSLRVAMKALEDLTYPHAKMARVGGVSNIELARLEISFCFLTGFELVVGEETLRKHWETLKEMQGPKLPTLLLDPRRERATPPLPSSNSPTISIINTTTNTTITIAIAKRRFATATRTPTTKSPSTSHPAAATITTTTTNAAMASIDVETILKGKYPAKAHAKRVVEYIRTKVPDATGVLYVEGQTEKMIEDCDEPVPFRQRRAFMYLTGVDLADCSLIYDMATDQSTLFIPPIDPESVIWSGLPLSPQEALEKYDVDAVLPSTELNPTLARLGSSSPDSTIYAIADRVADSVTFLEFTNKNFTVLSEAIDECRVIKDDYEVALIKKANQISGAAHRAVFENARKVKNEYELEGVFIGTCFSQGAKNQAYPSIVASGQAAATLHYVHNDQDLAGKDLLLLDAGAEWRTYAADITRTFPVSGRFTEQSRAIYEIVLEMQTKCIAMLKADVPWEEVHLLAHRTLIDGLLSLGILKGDRKEILESRTSVAFLPHGLGHYLGMDTHDTGGHPNYLDPDPIFRYLRVRMPLPEGSVITVEPGIYFCEFIIRPYLENPKHSKYIDENVLNNYWSVGGVRIEDNLLITKDGSVNLTDVPKDPDELEKIILGS
ncbi:peptidase M24, structural domain-containing protein [Biscogniauxia mediterranea]|nr:peptidase M24, structural domain-containing protein [Biscogniauxia mediterranea]